MSVLQLIPFRLVFCTLSISYNLIQSSFTHRSSASNLLFLSWHVWYGYKGLQESIPLVEFYENDPVKL